MENTDLEDTSEKGETTKSEISWFHENTLKRKNRDLYYFRKEQKGKKTANEKDIKGKKESEQ